MSDQKPAKPVINLDEVVIGDRPAMFQPKGAATERFTSRIGMVSARIGARMLGYNITAVPAGKRAFPLHNHHANEEMFFILQGSGELRVGEERWTIRQGDFIASPPGGPEVAHQIINTGATTMRYLALSTLADVEVCEYPDSQKISVVTGQRGERGLRKMFRAENTVHYYDREEK
jgi:uncharacterized cupin superfamily protein